MCRVDTILSSSQFREKIANMEAKRPVVTGIYQLVAVGPDGNLIAKMDVSNVKTYRITDT